ncbi:MAG: hypothetical protein PXY39_08045 [archaeon]|jgi:hypothetical protein|nr:hypothetical protein [archaeon]
MNRTRQEAIQTQEEEKESFETGMMTPFCEANLNFVHNELLYILHPRMQVGETVYIENAP